MKHIIRLNVILGVWLLVSPFAFGYYTASFAAMWNDVIVGLAIIGCAWCVMTESPGSAFCSGCSAVGGAWLLLAPFMLNYRNTGFRADVIIGGLVVMISVVETWRIAHRPPTIA